MNMIQTFEESIELNQVNCEREKSLSSSSLTNKNKNDDEINESDDHLPRVQVELDKLNYANESINNLELELEESKREYIQTMQDTEDQLCLLEKKLGNCVEKSKPYYESRIELNEAREKYLKAKNRFETAQELYVAAKKMQMYAEDNLENFSEDKITSEQVKSNHNYDKDTLVKMLEIAKTKVNETELSKQSSDIEQIEAFKLYDEKRIKVEEMEKTLRKSIEKSKKYFELKSSLYKELRFLFTKIEGLKSCLKEAKSAYQQSLRNLELISTEIHTQRKTMSLVNSSSNNSANKEETKDDSFNKLTSNSTSTLSSSSSLVSLNNPIKNTNSKLDDSEIKTIENEQEDFDIYFKNDLDDKTKKDIQLKSLSRGNSDKINSNNRLHMTDDDIDHLKLDMKLKQYKNNLSGNVLNSTEKKSDEIILKVNVNGSVSLPNSPSQTNVSRNRPQFRIPSFLNNINKK